MKSAAKLSSLLVLLVSLPGFADEPADGRRGWFYASGAIRKIDGARWKEKSPAGLFTYREVDRQPHYVELHDFDRRLSVRVYDTALYAWRDPERTWHLAQTGRWDDPNKLPLDLARNAELRGHFQTPSERGHFPRLGHDYEVLAAGSDAYNCISWTLGVTDRWVWPAQPGLPITFDDFDSLYSRHGYRK